MKKHEVAREIYKKEYLATHTLKRCLVCYHEEMEITWGIETLDATQEIMYQANYVFNKISLEQNTSKMKEISSKEFSQFGMAGVAYKITLAEEKEIIAEQVVAQIKADEKAEIKKIEEEKAIVKSKKAKEEKRKSIFAKAKETGEKQLLNSWCTDCCDPREECNIDAHYEWAMPNETVECTWTHTW